MPDKFPIGAWVCDPAQLKTTGGMGYANGRRTFLPYRGQVVSWGKVGKLPGYRIKYAGILNVISVAGAQCDTCRTTDESNHHPACFEAFRRGKAQAMTTNATCPLEWTGKATRATYLRSDPEIEGWMLTEDIEGSASKGQFWADGDDESTFPGLENLVWEEEEAKS